jgi:hypothetical protein
VNIAKLPELLPGPLRFEGRFSRSAAAKLYAATIAPLHNTILSRSRPCIRAAMHKDGADCVGLRCAWCARASATIGP